MKNAPKKITVNTESTKIIYNQFYHLNYYQKCLGLHYYYFVKQKITLLFLLVHKEFNLVQYFCLL